MVHVLYSMADVDFTRKHLYLKEAQKVGVSLYSVVNLFFLQLS